MSQFAACGIDFYLGKPTGRARNVFFYDARGLSWESRFIGTDSIMALAIRERRTIAYMPGAPEYLSAPGPFIPLERQFDY